MFYGSNPFVLLVVMHQGYEVVQESMKRVLADVTNLG